MQLPSYTNMDPAPPPHLILDLIHNPRNPIFKFPVVYQDLLSHNPNQDKKFLQTFNFSSYPKLTNPSSFSIHFISYRTESYLQCTRFTTTKNTKYY